MVVWWIGTRLKKKGLMKKMRKTILVSVVGLAVLAPIAVETRQDVHIVVVPAGGNLWLAGQPEGTGAGAVAPGEPSVDFAPTHSPVGIQLEPGATYFYVGVGSVSFDPGYPQVGPGGIQSFWVTHNAGPENGILDLSAPVGSLIGLWSDSNQPVHLGASGFITASQSGFLYLSLHDGWGWFNNWGAFAVSIAKQ